MTETSKFARRTFLKGGLGAASTLAMLPVDVAAAPAKVSTRRAASRIARLSRLCIKQFGVILRRTASQQFGMNIDAERVATAQQGDFFIATAPVSGLYLIDPFRYIDGVDIGFLYVTLPQSDGAQPRIRPDFYVVRAIAPITQVGEITGVTQLVNRRGEPVLERPATFDTFSVTVPDNVEDTTRATAGLLSQQEDDRQTPGLTITFWCSNGVHVIIIINAPF